MDEHYFTADPAVPFKRAPVHASVWGRELELAWAALLSDAMRRGAIPADDPRLLARAVLGSYNSIWQWYRPNGAVALKVSAWPRRGQRRNAVPVAPA